MAASRSAYRHEPVRSSAGYDARSFRVVPLGRGVKGIVGCRKGDYRPRGPRGAKCATGLELVTKLVPRNPLTPKEVAWAERRREEADRLAREAGLRGDTRLADLYQGAGSGWAGALASFGPGRDYHMAAMLREGNPLTAAEATDLRERAAISKTAANRRRVLEGRARIEGRTLAAEIEASVASYSEGFADGQHFAAALYGPRRANPRSRKRGPAKRAPKRRPGAANPPPLLMVLNAGGGAGYSATSLSRKFHGTPGRRPKVRTERVAGEGTGDLVQLGRATELRIGRQVIPLEGFALYAPPSGRRLLVSRQLPSMAARLERVGPAHGIAYIGPRWSRSKRRGRVEWDHTFGRGVVAWATPDRSTYVVGGGRFRVRQWLEH